MKSKFQVSNRYLSSIANGSSIDSSSETGDFVVSAVTVDGYTLPGAAAADTEGQKKVYFLLVDYNTANEEIFRIYRTDLTNKTLYFDKRFSYPNGKKTHGAGSSVQLNDVAEFVNALSENVDTFGHCEKVNGASPAAVVLRGGYPVYDLASLTSTTSVSDTNLAVGTGLTDNADNYVYFDFATGAFLSTNLAGLASVNGALMAKVVVAGGAVGTITDYRKASLSLAFNTSVFETNSGSVRLKDGGVGLAKLAAGGAASGDVLMWNGSTWTAATPATITAEIQFANSAQSIAGTDTSGAINYVVRPSDIAKNIQSGTFTYAASADVSDTYTATLTPALTAYATGMEAVVKFTTANTGACTINLNGLGAKSIKNQFGNDLSDGMIAANSVHTLTYDGTNFVVAVAAEPAVQADVTTGTNTVKYVTPKVLHDVAYATKLTASNNLKSSADTERLSGDLSYAKFKEIKLWDYVDGSTIRVSFDLRSQDTNSVNGRVYKNGVAVGTEQVKSDTSYTTFTEDFTVKGQDTIELWARRLGAVGFGVRNFRIYYDVWNITKETTVIQN